MQRNSFRPKTSGYSVQGEGDDVVGCIHGFCVGLIVMIVVFVIVGDDDMAVVIVL
jgi:hypothetical protein